MGCAWGETKWGSFTQGAKVRPCGWATPRAPALCTHPVTPFSDKCAWHLGRFTPSAQILSLESQYIWIRETYLEKKAAGGRAGAGPLSENRLSRICPWHTKGPVSDHSDEHHGAGLLVMLWPQVASPCLLNVPSRRASMEMLTLLFLPSSQPASIKNLLCAKPWARAREYRGK